MNVAKIAYNSTIYGPGKRTVIWFQGCSIKCEGCINPDLIPFIKKTEIQISKLIDKIENDKVTILGGEPLDQEEIYLFLEQLYERNIKTVLFSGYDWGELTTNQQDIISSTCQFAVLGPFKKSLFNKKLYLRGSENQEIRMFDKSIKLNEDFETYEIIIDKSIEIRGRVNKNIFDVLED